MKYYHIPFRAYYTFHLRRNIESSPKGYGNIYIILQLIYLIICTVTLPLTIACDLLGRKIVFSEFRAVDIIYLCTWNRK